MKKIIFLFFSALLLFSCKKNDVTQTDVSKKSNATTLIHGTDTSKNTAIANRLPNGTDLDNGGNTSGVDATTGYTILTKHYDQNSNWDGTYDFPWYNYSLNVTIDHYASNAAFGDPVFAQSFSSLIPGSYSAAPYQGYGSTGNLPEGGFKLDYIIWNVPVVTYTPPPSDWNPAANNGAGAYVNSNRQGSWDISGGGSYTVHDYGKLIKINAGSGFAAAQLNWSANGYPSSPNTPIVVLKNQLLGQNLPTPITVDFMQNGIVVQTNTFPAPTFSTGISLPSGSYTLRFTVPAGFENYFVHYGISPGTPGNMGWDAGNGSTTYTTPNPINLDTGISYTISVNQQ